MLQGFSETKSRIYNKVFYACCPEFLDFFSKIKAGQSRTDCPAFFCLRKRQL